MSGSSSSSNFSVPSSFITPLISIVEGSAEVASSSAPTAIFSNFARAATDRRAAGRGVARAAREDAGAARRGAVAAAVVVATDDIAKDDIVQSLAHVVSVTSSRARLSTAREIGWPEDDCHVRLRSTQTFFTHRSVSPLDRVPFQLTDEYFLTRLQRDQIASARKTRELSMTSSITERPAPRGWHVAVVHAQLADRDLLRPSHRRPSPRPRGRRPLDRRVGVHDPERASARATRRRRRRQIIRPNRRRPLPGTRARSRPGCDARARRARTGRASRPRSRTSGRGAKDQRAGDKRGSPRARRRRAIIISASSRCATTTTTATTATATTTEDARRLWCAR